MKDFKLSEHRADVEKLLVYIPWLESKAGNSVSHIYNDNSLSQTTVPFPVYDATLLSFVNDALETSLMDENYMYDFAGYNVKTIYDEIAAVENATTTEGPLLCGVLSKYVLGGRTKGRVWSTAVEEGVFLAVLKQFKKLLEIWDKPLA